MVARVGGVSGRTGPLLNKELMRRSIGMMVTVIVLSTTVTCQAASSDGVELSGDILAFVLPATAAGLTLGYRDAPGTVQFGESMALTLGVTFGLKYSIHAQRPDNGSQSFPSGHTSISFCSAEFLRKRYGWEYGLPAYAVASYVGYSRIESKRHYPRDVAAGAALGFLSSYLFTKPYYGWTVEPQVDADYYGIRLVKSW